MNMIRRICWLILILALINLRLSDRYALSDSDDVYAVQNSEHQNGKTITTYSSKLKEISESFNTHNTDTRPVHVVENTVSESAVNIEPKKEQTHPAYYGGNGTVKSIDGTTVVVSIFASDESSSWNWNNQNDLDTYSAAYWNLMEAGEWLEGEAGRYDASTEIICDWMEYNELYREAYFSEQMLKEETYTFDPMSDYVNRYIDSAGIMERFNADSIVYIFYFNGNDNNKTWAYAYPVFSTVKENNWQNEVILLNCGNPSYIMKAGTIAHELLHTFGLPDMYYANERITQAYVDYLGNINSDEIMFGHADWDYYDIQPHFTELDAYYLGLTSYSEDLYEWGLGSDIFCN